MVFGGMQHDPPSSPSLRLNLFGPVSVERDGVPAAMPASRKTRAILGYLALSGRPVSRQRLCDVFFDAPDDPRASLRWSLTKLRPLVDDTDAPRLVAERDMLRLELRSLGVDALEVQSIAACPIEALTVKACDDALAMMSGALLEDCELPERPEYTAWLAAQRQDFQSLALRLARAAVEKSAGADRIARLHKLVSLDPLDESAAAALSRALWEAGRRDEAHAAISSAERALAQAGLTASPSLRGALRTLRSAPQAPVAPETPAALAADDDRISVAVIPFLNHSGETLSADAVESFLESLVHLLSKFRDLRVVGYAKSRQFKGDLRDPAAMGASLGASYLIGGSLYAREGALKARYRLVAAADGALMTSGDVDFQTADPFVLVDDAPAHLAALLSQKLINRARALAVATPLTERGAWRHYHAGVVEGLAAAPAKYDVALQHFDRAIAADPGFAKAIGAAAWAKACLGYGKDVVTRQETLMQARRAIALGADDAEALAIGAWAAVHVAQDFDAALAAVAKAVHVNPLSRVAWSTSGWVRAMAGETDAPLSHFDRAERYDPQAAHLDNVEGGRAFCHWTAQRYDDALSCAERAIALLPGHVGAHAIAMASAMALADAQTARAAAQRFLETFPAGLETEALHSIPIRSRERRHALIEAVRAACALVREPSPSGIADEGAETSGANGGAPVVAVLPLLDVSATPLPKHAVMGLLEGLTQALARFRSIIVISAASTSRYADRLEDPKQIADALGADILVGGSVMTASDGRVRVRWRAIAGETGRLITSGDIDGRLDDLWALQEEAAQSVAVQVEPRAQAEALKTRAAKPTASADAYDLYLRGLYAGFSVNSSDYEAALTHFERALRLDPEFHPALAFIPWAAAYANRIASPTDLARYAQMSRDALRFGRDDARTQATAGTALFYMAHDFENARAAIERALSLNPNEYTAWICGGWIHAMRGENGPAHSMFDRAERLNPLAYGANGLLSGRAMADFMSARMSDAERCIKMALSGDDSHPSALMTGVATAHALGLAAERRDRRARFLAIYPEGLDTIAIRALPFEDPTCRKRYFDAVAAGLAVA